MSNRDSILHIWKECELHGEVSGLEHIAKKIYQTFSFCVMEFEYIETVCQKTESIDGLIYEHEEIGQI